MRCWTCESKLEGQPKILGGTRQIFTCHTCTGLIELGRIREKIETSQAQSLGDALRLFEESTEDVTKGPQEIVSAIEWGFEDIGWNLDQMTGVLKSIDTTLKTPSLIKANEWRQIAEELRRRGVLDESEEFFLKSLRANPLDYRTYIGLGKTYLQMEKSDLARTYWEKSLPHAPEEEIDYKSYSYRLIGRIYFCEENYQQAALALKKAIELSPRYYPGHYDYAQYCALIGDKKNCLSSLKIAVEKEPLPLGLVRQERNLQVFKKEIENLLRTVDPNELNFRAWLKEKLQNASWVPTEVRIEILKSERNLEIFNEVVDDLESEELESQRARICLYAQTERKLEEAKKIILNLYGEENVNKILSVARLCYRHLSGNYGNRLVNPLKNIFCESLAFYATALVNWKKMNSKELNHISMEDIKSNAQNAIEVAEKEAQLSYKELGRIIENSIKNARRIQKEDDRDRFNCGNASDKMFRLARMKDDNLGIGGGDGQVVEVEGIAKKQIMAPNSGLVLQKAQNKKETEEEEEKRRRKRRHVKRLRRESSLYRYR